MPMLIKSLCGVSHQYSEETAKQTAREIILLLQRKADIVQVRNTSLTIIRTPDDTFKAAASDTTEPVEYARLWRMADFYARSTIEPEEAVLAALDELKPA